MPLVVREDRKLAVFERRFALLAQKEEKVDSRMAVDATSGSAGGGNEEVSEGAALVWMAVDATSDSAGVGQRVSVGTSSSFILPPSIDISEDTSSASFRARTVVCSTSHFQLCRSYIQE